MYKYIDEHFDEYLKDLSKLVSFNSVLCDDAKPFGLENQKVLDAALKIMEEKGLKTQNLDYYCGYGEVGEGEELIGILAHLDIVPVGDGWYSDPLTLTIKDGILYGRGVSDDKGPGLSALYALKYLIDTNYQFKKRVRLIFGCNEETGSKCIKHYVLKCGHIDMGFTPDASFPGIYGEKGMLGGNLIFKNSKIIDIKGGGATNVVCDKVVVKLPLDSFKIDKFETYLKTNNIKYELNINDDIEIIVYGKLAHASTPDLGINAINYLFEGLYEAEFNDITSDIIHEYFGLDCHGKKIGFEEIKDELSNTSINFGVVKKIDNNISLSFDIRFPVKSNIIDAKNIMERIKNDNVVVDINNMINPLFFDIDKPMIKALKKAYEDVSGDYESQMEVIGGGTYAKTINNCIAFGGEFNDGIDNNIHGANERIEIATLKKQIAIYIEAIKNLNEV